MLAIFSASVIFNGTITRDGCDGDACIFLLLSACPACCGEKSKPGTWRLFEVAQIKQGSVDITAGVGDGGGDLLRLYSLDGNAGELATGAGDLLTFFPPQIVISGAG